MNAKDKLIRSRVRLNKENPFFGYLVLHLKLNEVKETFVPVVDEEGNVGVGKQAFTCGVDGDGNFYYNPDFVDKLTESEMKGVLCHEVMHLALGHPWRLRNRIQKLFNIANDMVINDIITCNGFELPDGVLLPKDHKIDFFGKTIEDLNDKSSEQLYDELYKLADKKGKIIKIGNGSGKGQNPLDKYKGFDEHIYGGKGKKKQNKNGKGQSQTGNGIQQKAKNQEREWKKRLVEAGQMAKQRGDIPSGMERIIDTVLETRINWKSMLYRYLTNTLPFDWNYNYPSKKSRVVGFYMPSVKKECLEVVVSVDTSGSISQKELTEFLTEIVGIAKSFANIHMTLIVCDCKIQDVYEVRNGNINKIMNMKMRGGGGTSHVPVYNWCEKEKPTTRLLINFTDGYTEFPRNSILKNKTLWVLTKNAIDKKSIPFGSIISLAD